MKKKNQYVALVTTEILYPIGFSPRKIIDVAVYLTDDDSEQMADEIEKCRVGILRKRYSDTFPNLKVNFKAEATIEPYCSIPTISKKNN